jgi:hypothetical protein
MYQMQWGRKEWAVRGKEAGHQRKRESKGRKAVMMVLLSLLVMLMCRLCCLLLR